MNTDRCASSTADYFYPSAVAEHLKNTVQQQQQHYIGQNAPPLPMFPMLHSTFPPLQHFPSPLFIQNMLAAASAAASMSLKMPLHNFAPPHSSFSALTHFSSATSTRPTASNHADFEQWNCLAPLGSGTLDYRPMKRLHDTSVECTTASKTNSSSVIMPANCSQLVKVGFNEQTSPGSIVLSTSATDPNNLQVKLDSKEVIIQEMLRQATVPSTTTPRQFKVDENCSGRELMISSEEHLKTIDNNSFQCSTSSPPTTPPLLSKYNMQEEALEHQIVCLPTDASHSIVKSPVKSKMQKCKQCNFLSESKEALWQHLHTHISPNKAIRCPKCPFITEYKHHLEYHIRNHLNSKPFQCEQCSYRCVNKSMLNSHMKSHTNVYQYRCANCSYATKYSHSLKQHLRKYNHTPSIMLNVDGSIDLSVEAVTTETDVMLNKIGTDSNVQSSPTARGSFYFPNLFSPLLSSPIAIPNNNNMNSSPEECAAAATAAILIQQKFSSPAPSIGDGFNEPIDLSITAKCGEKTTFVTESGGSTRLEDIVRRLQQTDMKCKKEVQENRSDTQNRNGPAGISVDSNTLECCFCGLVFRDIVMYRIHMDFHSSTSENAFTCAQCHKSCRDRMEFNSHLLHASHA